MPAPRVQHRERSTNQVLFHGRQSRRPCCVMAPRPCVPDWMIYKATTDAWMAIWRRAFGRSIAQLALSQERRRGLIDRGVA